MAQGTPLSGAGSVHPGRMTVGQHLPYTGREVELFSRPGYFYPSGYLPNTPAGFFRGLAQSFINPGFGMKANVGPLSTFTRHQHKQGSALFFNSGSVLQVSSYAWVQEHVVGSLF